MEEASEELRFEDAARYRDAIAAAEELSETQRVTMAGDNDMDIVLPVKDIENAFIVLLRSETESSWEGNPSRFRRALVKTAGR